MSDTFSTEKPSDVDCMNRKGVKTFEIVASYADGRHYVETTDEVLDALVTAKEHLDHEACDYVRIMRQRNAMG